jgi:hypothetical protein
MKNVRTVENIELPEQSVFYRNLIEKYSHLKGLQIQDLHKAKPQILIGQEHAALLVSKDFREGGFNEPVASLTKLGWVVHGKTRSKEDRDENVMTVCECQTVDDSLHDLVKQYFNIDSIGIRPLEHPLESVENERAQLLITSTIKNIGKKYEIGLLWRNDDVKLPLSYNMALKRLEGVEHKMKREPELAKWYSDKIVEYLEKGYLRRMNDEDN